MLIKADKEQLTNVSENLLKSSSVIDEELLLWENTISELKNIWQGKDADIFYSRIDSYLVKLKMITTTSNTIGTFINSANNNYIESDEEFTSALRRENDNYEPRQL